MKTVTYNYEKIVRACQLINKLEICGIDQARFIAEIGDILDNGKIGEIIVKENKADGLERETLQPDKLEE